jgi:endonuclease G
MLKFIVPYGLPSFDLENVLVRDGFIVGYDRRTRNPSWVAEHFSNHGSPSSASSIATNEDGVNDTDKKKVPADRANVPFKPDPVIPRIFQGRLEDYAGSGFDRGHMCPASDLKHSQEAMNSSFLLSNISPQVYVLVISPLFLSFLSLLFF